MADAKIINYGQPIGAGSTAIPDNNATALNIESTDGNDIVTVDTTDDAEKVTISVKNNPAISIVHDSSSDKIHVGINGAPEDQNNPVLQLTGDGSEAELIIRRNTLSSSNDEVAYLGYRAQSAFSIDAEGGIQFRNQGGSKRAEFDSSGNFTTYHPTTISNAAPTLTITNTTASDDHLARDGLIAFKGTQSGDEVTTLGSIRAEHYNGSDDQAGLMTFSVNDGNDGDGPTDYLKLRGGQADLNVKLSCKVGSAAEPGVSFYNDANSGLYGDELDTVGLSTAGVARLTVAPTGRVTATSSAVVKGKASFVLTGSIDVTGTNVNVPGTGTKFLSELAIGDDILVSGETRTIATITNDTTATVTAAWGSDLANDTSPECNPAAFTVVRDTGALGMVVADDGSVGIGEAANALAPTSRFSVSAGNSNVAFFERAGNSGYFKVESSSDTATIVAGEVLVIKTNGGTEAIRVDTSQNVGIAMTPGGSHKLDVTGTAGLSTGTAWTNTSDSRIKTNVQNIENALDKINGLRPVSFNYTEDYLSVHAEVDGSKRYNSFIAQEYGEVFPDAVSNQGSLERVITPATDDAPAVKETLLENVQQFTPHDLHMYLVGAVQELASQNEALAARIATLEAGD